MNSPASRPAPSGSSGQLNLLGDDPVNAPPVPLPGSDAHNPAANPAKGSAFASAPDLPLEQMREHAGRAARLLKALANENRLMILCALSQGELSVGELNQRVDLAQSALSQHLAVLRTDKLVATRRQAQSVYYSLEPGVAMRIIELLHAHYCGSDAAAASAPTPDGTTR